MEELTTLERPRTCSIRFIVMEMREKGTRTSHLLSGALSVHHGRYPHVRLSFVTNQLAAQFRMIIPARILAMSVRPKPSLLVLPSVFVPPSPPYRAVIPSGGAPRSSSASSSGLSSCPSRCPDLRYLTACPPCWAMSLSTASPNLESAPRVARGRRSQIMG